MKVILAIDGSEESLAGARFLTQLPFREKPSVVVLTALINPYYDTIAGETDYQFGELEREAAGRNYSEVKQILDSAGFPSEHQMAIGHPSRLIMDHAEQVDADLIVMGARGHSAVFRVMLGSNADYVASHAKCPVLIVRPRTNDRPFDAADHPYRILLAYDESENAKVALEQMVALDWPESASIHISRMLERPSMLPDEIVYDVQMLSEAEEKLSKLAKSLPCKCHVMHSVREAIHVGSAFLLPDEMKETDLLFMGNTGRSAISRFFLGSTSRYLLHHAPCSIWIARTKNWKS